MRLLILTALAAVVVAANAAAPRNKRLLGGLLGGGGGGDSNGGGGGGGGLLGLGNVLGADGLVGSLTGPGGIAGSLVDTLANLGGSLGETVGDVVKGVVELVENLVDTLADALAGKKNVAATITLTAAQLANSVPINELAGAVGSVLEKVPGLDANQFVSAVALALPDDNVSRFMTDIAMRLAGNPRFDLGDVLARLQMGGMRNSVLFRLITNLASDLNLSFNDLLEDLLANTQLKEAVNFAWTASMNLNGLASSRVGSIIIDLLSDQLAEAQSLFGSPATPGVSG